MKIRRWPGLDFQTLDDAPLRSLKGLLRSLARLLARDLGASIQPDQVWDEQLGDTKSFEQFVERGLLSGTQAPVVVCLDEVDRVFEYRYRNAFFRAVRGWHNRRAFSEPWRKLTLILGHSTEPSLWIQNLNESPFNVGERLRLGDFSPGQVEELNGKCGQPLRDQPEIDDLVRLVGGHPYLVRQALFTLKTEKWKMADLRRVATRGDGPFGDHLRRIVWVVRQDRSLTTSVKGILRGRPCKDDSLLDRLVAAGLVKGESRDAAQMRCELYALYLEDRL